jgi:UDPglucose 6-dehydrogenase
MCSDKSFDIDTISVVGLGKLGSPLAAAYAHKGFNVIGLDLNKRYVDLINKGFAPVEETGLADLILEVRDRLSATTDYREAILNSQVTTIIVPTPTGPDGTFILDYVLDAIHEIGTAFREKDDYHLVIIVSTVMPGHTDVLRRSLEEVSGKKCGPDFGLCYSPEFIALGSVLYNLMNPDMILIGESDARAGNIYESIQCQLVDNTPPFMHMNFVNAELSKIGVNTYVTMKITYANMLARICEKMPGADVHVVTHAVGQDTRIGTKYMKGAVAFGGPCFPRDNVAFAKAAEAVGATAPLAEITHEFNLAQTSLLAETVAEHVEAGQTVTVLGLAYKPDTPVVEESASLYLIRELVRQGYIVVAYDPMAIDNARQKLEDIRVEYADTLDKAVGASDLIIIATPWEEFKQLGSAKLTDGVKIIDGWNVLDEATFEPDAQLIRLGVGPKAQEK